MKKKVSLIGIICFLTINIPTFSQDNKQKNDFIDQLKSKKEELVKRFENLKTKPRKGKANAFWRDLDFIYRYKFKAKKSGKIHEIVEIQTRKGRSFLPLLYIRFFNGNILIAERYTYDPKSSKVIIKEVLLNDNYIIQEY